MVDEIEVEQLAQVVGPDSEVFVERNVAFHTDLVSHHSPFKEISELLDVL